MASVNVNSRTRNWCAIVYPDSALKDWESYLDSLNIKWACSPLHDKDVDDDGCLKKAHYHIILCYSGNKSFKQVCDDLAEINCPIPQVCRDVRGSLRYFIHKDHPHKFQYSIDDIRAFGGFQIDDYLKLSSTEKNQILKDVINFVNENEIFEYADLIDFSISDSSPVGWFDVIHTSTIFLSKYLDSRRWKLQQQKVGEENEI